MISEVALFACLMRVRYVDLLTYQQKNVKFLSIYRFITYE
jgi:hypothetical protein